MTRKSPTAMDRQVFKVQIDSTGQRVLMYNEDRSLQWEGDLDPMVALAFFGPEDEEPAATFGDLAKRKRFIWGYLEDTIIVLDEPYVGEELFW